MATARTDHKARIPGGDVAATPFDMGAGRIDLAAAGRAGFVLDETGPNYAAANPSIGGDPATLNHASLADGNCMSSCTWTRTLRSTANTPVDWTVAVTAPPALTVTVAPASFTLQPGAAQVVTFTADVRAVHFDEWAFAQVDFTPNDLAVAPAHFPLAARSSAGEAPAFVPFDTRRNQGVYTLQDLHTMAVPQLGVTLGTVDLTPTLIQGEIAARPDQRRSLRLRKRRRLQHDADCAPCGDVFFCRDYRIHSARPRPLRRI